MSNTTAALVVLVRLVVIGMIALALSVFVADLLQVEGRPELADEVTEIVEPPAFVLPVFVPELVTG